MTLALIGANALFLLYAWLACCIAASYLSGRKGYGEKIGLASGLFLAPIGVLIWAVWPPKPESDWKAKGAFGRTMRTQPPSAGDAGPTQATGARAG